MNKPPVPNKLKLVIKQRRVFFPRIPIVGLRLPLNWSFKLPSIEGLNFGKRAGRVVAFSLVVSAVVISAALYFSIRGIDPSPTWPDAAEYSAEETKASGKDTVNVGKKAPPLDNTDPEEEPVSANMTLRLNIGGSRVEELIFTDLSVGKATGLTDAIKISAASGNIVCDTLIFEDVMAPDFSLVSSTAYSLVVATTTADGLSINPTLSSSVINHRVGSSRGTLSVPAVKDSTFDRILIESSTTSTVGLIKFQRVKAFGAGAGISISNVSCGKVIIRGTDPQLSVIGDGSGIDSASFTIGASTRIGSSTITGNIEKPVSVQ